MICVMLRVHSMPHPSVLVSQKPSIISCTLSVHGVQGCHHRTMCLPNAHGSVAEHADFLLDESDGKRRGGLLAATRRPHHSHRGESRYQHAIQKFARVLREICATIGHSYFSCEVQHAGEAAQLAALHGGKSACDIWSNRVGMSTESLGLYLK